MKTSTSKSKLGFWVSLLVVAILALWIRVEYIQNTLLEHPIGGDATRYVQYAVNLVNYGTFSKDQATDTPQPDAYWAPGYPTFIASTMLLENKFGFDTYRRIIFLQAVMGSITVVLTLLLGRLFLNHQWALVAATLTAFSPHLISLGNYVLTETLFALLFLLSIYIFILAFTYQYRGLFTLAGTLFGLAYLVNPVVFFTPILFAALAVLLYKYKQEKPLLASLVLIAPCLIVFFIMVGGWAARGAVSVPTDSPSGSSRLLTNLVIGAHHDFHTIWRANTRDPNNPATIDLTVIGDSYPAFINLMLDRISEEPLHYAKWYLLQKPIMLWDWNILTGQGDIHVYPVKFSLYQVSKPALLSYVIMRSMHYWLFGFSILGLIFVFRQYKRAGSDTLAVTSLFLYLSVIYISAVYVISQAEARYSIPLRPEMYLCAAYFFSQVTTFARKYKSLTAANST